jgi:serine/threonine-protein kinase
LPSAVQRDRARLDRFLNEVKVALKVTHPNVCRVYDIGEVDGQHYISMEYVDGEDLASLLRRIGRLPQDKAVQLARQLCAGLAAAHEEGILHRDLKPANVMIDGRGRAKITDFGLASLAEGIEGDEVRAGTPQYMSPEQHAGKEVTARSDIYSLGLVLYELFTGKRAFEGKTPAEIARLQEHSVPTSPSSHVEGLDQTIERIILSCLESDSGQRPATALTVAAALPGGDPLAAALAAGETPTPGMIANAGDAKVLRPAVAFSCAAIILVSMAASIFFTVKYPIWDGLPGLVTMEKRPEVLAQDARAILEKLGHTEDAADHAFGFAVDNAYLGHVRNTDDSPGRWESLKSGRPPAVYFWYRQSPRPLKPRDWLNERVWKGDPEVWYSGEVTMDLDPSGRLRWLKIMPPQMDESEGPAPETDWSTLFTAAGLNEADFEPVQPVWLPYRYCDRRAAWEGSYPGDPEHPVRVEAGSYRGKPVFFTFVDAHTRPWQMEVYELPRGLLIWQTFGICMFIAMITAAVVLARRNLRLGRGDRRGATRLAVIAMIALALRWLFLADHVPDIQGEFHLLTQAMAFCMFVGGLSWLAYIAAEPYLRRRRSNTLVSWNRLLIGRFRDPLVGRELLIGSTAYWAYLILVLMPLELAPVWLGIGYPRPHWPATLEALLGGRHVAGTIIGDLLWPVPLAWILLFLLFFLRVVLRKQWIAYAAFTMIVAVPTTIMSEPPFLLFNLGYSLCMWMILLFLLSRIGFLSVYSFMATSFLLLDALGSPDWYLTTSAVFTAVALAIPAYGLFATLSGRQLLRDGVVPED